MQRSLRSPSSETDKKYLLYLACLNIAVQAIFLLVVTYTPALAGAEVSGFLAPITQQPRDTRVYTLGQGETVTSVAEKYHITTKALRQLNQLRTFAHGFDHLQAGDELDVPSGRMTQVKLGNHNIAGSAGKDGDTEVKKTASLASQAGGFLSNKPSGDAAASMVRGLVTGEAGGQLQQWLSQFGTSRVQLEANKDFSLRNSQFDLLFPLYENNQSLLFMQGGIRKPLDRLTGNLGYGVRTFWQSGWMFGGNVFYDDDLTGHNRRVGIGGEAWRDYFRLSANTYLGTTKWHASRDFDGTWQEKPADGYDVRAEGWLPAYPQLGGKLIWEQYYGQQVALFDKDRLQRNPNAFTAGVGFTPVPLITLSAEQRQGRGQHDTQFALSVNWSFGHNWRWQLTPANVETMRVLAGSRYDLVNRNNEIVLKYRKNPAQGVANLLLTVVKDNSPADGVTRNVLQVLATNRSGQPVRNATINWLAPSLDNSASLTAASSTTDDNGLATATLTSTTVQTVTVTAQNNSISGTQNSHFVAVAVSKMILDVTQDNAVAGRGTNTVVAILTDGNDRPVAGKKVNWILPEGVSMNETSSSSDSSGKATVHLSATAAGSAVISAAADSQMAGGTVHFTGDNNTARIVTLTVTSDGSPADGKTANAAQAIVTDANDNPLPGQSITWKADKSTVTFSPPASTDSSGRTTVSYTDTIAESLTLTGTLVNGNSGTAPSLFVSDEESARLKDMTVTSGAMASGSDKNTATVAVTDANGNPLANTTVMFSVTGSAKIAATVNTNSSGQALVTLTDTVAETVQVTAKLASGSSLAKESSFVADLDDAALAVTATTGAMSDGNATNTATITLMDKSGIALAGQTVAMSVDGSAKLSAASAITDSNGQIKVTLSDIVAETVTVTATLSNGKTASAPTAFISYNVTTLSASDTSLKADGSDASTLTATVKDSSGAVVENTAVMFTVTGSGKLSAATVNTDSSGQAQVTLTDTVGETITVTAKTRNNSSEAGKTQSITFVASSITGVGVYGTTYVFTPSQGFPQTGFAGARMYFLIDGSTTDVGSYTWSSNRSWVTMDNEVATMNPSAQSGDDSPALSDRQVTITASPKSGGKSLTYRFTLQKWYRRSSIRESVRIGASNYAASACRAFGTNSIESASDLTDGAVSVVGKLFGEWRDSSSLEKIAAFFWDAETTTTWAAEERIAFIYSTGVPGTSPLPGSTYVMCRVN